MAKLKEISRPMFFSIMKEGGIRKLNKIIFEKTLKTCPGDQFWCSFVVPGLTLAIMVTLQLNFPMKIR